MSAAARAREGLGGPWTLGRGEDVQIEFFVELGEFALGAHDEEFAGHGGERAVVAGGMHRGSASNFFRYHYNALGTGYPYFDTDVPRVDRFHTFEIVSDGDGLHFVIGGVERGFLPGRRFVATTITLGVANPDSKMQVDRVRFYVPGTPPGSAVTEPAPEGFTANGVGRALGILTHLIILLGFGAKLYAIWGVILDGRGPERFLRTAAFSVGVLITTATKAFGISIAEIIVQAILEYRPVSFALLGLCFPATLGVLLALYFTRVAHRSANIGQRVLVLITSLSVMQFADLYAAAFRISGLALDKALLPNTLFNLSVLLYLVLYWDPERQGGRIRRVPATERVRGL